MIIPAPFEKEFSEVERVVTAVDGLAPIIQIDIADGSFVDGETFQDVGLIGNLHMKSSVELHLMTYDAANILSKKIRNVTQACVHIELGEIFHEAEKHARTNGYHFGAALNPKTPIEDIEIVLDKIDYVQFMTVEPGGQGRPFEKEVLKKIVAFKQRHPTVIVQTDGAMDTDTIPLAVRAGADNIGIGSALVKAEDIREKFKEFVQLEKETK
ncbi:hypothetical protein HN803_05500 [candidate division WWE3 bacterium]|jgi:pentose-5-phosphate-3-epimerase|nr:hypothetical protein [candidate division WWE3 bacterium]MBT7350218.1 hypothetical protein [candidate division WWE3 bacterium]